MNLFDFLSSALGDEGGTYSPADLVLLLTLTPRTLMACFATASATGTTFVGCVCAAARRSDPLTRGPSGHWNSKDGLQVSIFGRVRYLTPGGAIVYFNPSDGINNVAKDYARFKLCGRHVLLHRTVLYTFFGHFAQFMPDNFTVDHITATRSVVTALEMQLGITERC